MHRLTSVSEFARFFQAQKKLHGYKGTCLTIGNFDGVHVGHQALLHRTVEKAQEHKLLSIVVTFWPHPLAVLAGGTRAPSLLLGQDERYTLFIINGIDLVLEMPFTMDLASLSPEEFIQHVLVPLECRELVIGYDFSLGKGRAGNFDVLQGLGKKYGFGVEQLSPVIVQDAVVSSTRIRNLVRQGEAWDIHPLLGRYYHLDGPIIHGYGRGDGLGFPTANLAVGATLVPKNGVYATWVTVHEDYLEDSGVTYPAVTNVGHVPTFGNDSLSVESFILQGNPDLYNVQIRLSFVQYIREEKQFSHVGQLQERIAKDVEIAKEILLIAHPI